MASAWWPMPRRSARASSPPTISEAAWMILMLVVLTIVDLPIEEPPAITSAEQAWISAGKLFAVKPPSYVKNRLSDFRRATRTTDGLVGGTSAARRCPDSDGHSS